MTNTKSASLVAAILVIAALALTFLTTAGCSTVAGVGEDISYASEATAKALGGDDEDQDDD